MGVEPPQLRLEVYVQSLTPETNHRLGVFLDRIGQLDTDGIVSSSKVYVVGAEICPEIAMKTESGQHLCGRILQFRDWARRTGRQLEPFFHPRAVESSITDETYKTVSLPTVTLAEFTGDTVRFVSPCTDGDTHWTPMGRLDAVGERFRPEARDTATPDT